MANGLMCISGFQFFVAVAVENWNDFVCSDSGQTHTHTYFIRMNK